VGDDGTPLRAASLELVRDFFYMAVIGDSVAWGNGLDDRNKFSALVANTIEQETGKRVIRQVYAQSGAAIVPDDEDGLCEFNCFGEAPTVDTSITVQADLIEWPEVMDLILLDGCINDVGVSTILFAETPDDELVSLTEQFCEEEMVILLQKVRSLAPQARIAVTAYFPVVSVESDLFGVRQWVLARGEEVGKDALEIKEELVSKSSLFYESSLQNLAAAVGAVNAMDESGEKILFAPVDFGASNATFAPDSWLWGLTAENELAEPLEIELKLFPEDQVVDFRSALCGQWEALGDVITCLYASVAHPNVAGAGAYAEAIIDRLRARGLLEEWRAAESQ
jgi:lysophospholipase L1-like esterase